MLYRDMPHTGDKLSTLGLGCMRLPGGQTRPDEKQAIELIRHAIDKGVNYFDTAWPYHGGKSEGILGRALRDGYREKVKIADKLPQWLCKSREDMAYYLTTQLARLDVSHIDYYLIHALDGGAWTKAKAHGVIDFLNHAKRSGKIVNAGFSFHGPREDFKAIIDDFDWDFCQIQFNILDENYQAGAEGLAYAQSKQIGVVVMEPLRGGSLAGQQPTEVEALYRKVDPNRSNVDWALRWIWNHPGVITVLSGMSTIAQVDENIAIASTAEVGAMSETELTTVREAARTFRGLMKVPCTACQYCMPCPHGVDIPTAFSFYNSKYLFKNGFGSRCMYLLQLGNKTREKPGLASACVNCGACLEHCPQKIAIPDQLAHVKREFEGFFTAPLRLLLTAAMSKGKRRR